MSIRTKTLLLVACPLLALSLLVGSAAMYSVQQSMLEELARTSENSMTFAVSAVTSRQHMLFRAKAQQALALKARMNSLSTPLEVLAKRAHNLPDFLQHYPLPPDMTLIAVDAQLQPLAHNGTELSANPYLLHDIKNRPVGTSMQRLAKQGLAALSLVQVATTQGASTEERNFFGTSFFLEQANVLVGLWTDISHLDKEQKRLMAESLDDLRASFSAISIGPSGFLMLMDEKGQILVGKERIFAHTTSPALASNSSALASNSSASASNSSALASNSPALASNSSALASNSSASASNSSASASNSSASASNSPALASNSSASASNSSALASNSSALASSSPALASNALALPVVEAIRRAAASQEQGATSATQIRLKETEEPLYMFVRHVKQAHCYVVGFASMQEALAPGKRLSLILVGTILAAMLLVLPLAALSVSRVTTPLAQLADYARNIPKQDFFAPSPLPSALQRLASGSYGQEVTELASSFLFMDATLRQRIKELLEASAARERLEGELNAAKEVQKGFLPLPLPPEVATGRFAVATSLVPARQVGGDLYDFFMLDTEHLCFLIGDVSDKGMPAALYMSIVMTLIRSHAKPHLSPAQLLDEVNEQLVKDNPTCMFVTLFIAILNLSTGTLAYANGGHNPPVLLRSNELPVWIDQRSGPLVGVMEHVNYQLHQLQLQPGDMLLLYTDGLTEALNSKNAMYGKERMYHCMNTAAHSPVPLLNALLADVGQHTNGHPASDDMTMLCLHYLGGDEKEPS